MSYDTQIDSTVILAEAIERLADAINHLAVASQNSPGGPPAPPSGAASPPLPPGAAGPPGGPQKSTQAKRGGLIFFTCKDHGTTALAVAETVLQHAVDADARRWDDRDQQAVLDAMKGWGWL